VTSLESAAPPARPDRPSTRVQSAVYRPGETHSITALDQPLVFHAVIAPRPG